MSDTAIATKTGKTWPQWFSAIDKAKGTTLTHQEIVALLRDRHGVGSWWQQMITVGYERARGMRVKHQTASGFQMSSTKTIAAPAAELFAAWTDITRRRKWLGALKLDVRTAHPPRKMRIGWKDGSIVEAHFLPKPGGKTQVTVSHTKLADAESVTRMKEFWKARLARLKQAVDA
ncbi:MAG: DUF4287 domain-containing protein [Gemmatimonadota bacterium]|nr:DUF4287 domain-containing protein [Gemmatimonadota bacterium]